MEQLLLKKSYSWFLNATLRKRIPFLSGERYILKYKSSLCMYIYIAFSNDKGNYTWGLLQYSINLNNMLYYHYVTIYNKIEIVYV